MSASDLHTVQDNALAALRAVMTSYAPISDSTWQALKSVCRFRSLSKNTVLYHAGDIPSTYAFIYQGLFRCYVCDEKGTEYNKNFFDEGMFPGSMTALLTHTPSKLAFQALEASDVIEINFSAYRQLLLEKDDLKLFQIHYLEKNWLLAKDAREIELVQEDATARYLRFVDTFPKLVERLPQYHIASHLGITPTQLSRIRKSL
ncbi:Crp/Fnr family transcriptional regulator [Sessilibacter corallicola]|uniref:Cyclic nucleotide-binding domain-containing protein n=1 Tax=Sessilibacter corallicola TaxID=2904075 RepID=A0ABQ0AAI0_9GAMM